MTRRRKKKKRREMTRNEKNKNELFKRGNYSLLRLHTIVNAAGPKGIPTFKLLGEIVGSRATYAQNIISCTARQGLIKRGEGEEPGPRQFAPIINSKTDKGVNSYKNNFFSPLAPI